jgi:hypothetical protein
MLGGRKTSRSKETLYGARFEGIFRCAGRGGWMAAGSAALAQTKPAVTSLGPDFPKTAIFIGNSFFYYNNGLPGHLSLMEKAADPRTGSSTGTPW